MIACDDRRDNRYFLLQVKLIRTIRHYHFNAARVVALLACLAAANLSAGDQSIYLIASEPYLDRLESFPTLLFRVENGDLIKVRTVTTQEQDTRFVDVYPGRGYALVGSDRRRWPGSLLLLDVIDMNSVSVQKSYEIDLCDDCSFLSSHMQDGPDGPVYFFYGYNRGSSSYKGVDLKTGRLMNGFDRIDQANAHRTGTGSSFVDRLRALSGIIHDGDLLIFGEGKGPRRRELGWRLPQEFGWELGSTNISLLVNNDEVRVVDVWRASDWKGEVRGMGVHVFDKAAGEWSKLDIRSGMGSFRAYGHWLAREDIQSYRPGVLNYVRLKRHRFPPFLSAAERFEFRRYAPSGRLFFYNARTKVVIVHDTGEPDSEVLYVDEDRFAYFRVSDELRRARIGDGKLGPEEVLVKAPELWAVHWLFFGRE